MFHIGAFAEDIDPGGAMANIAACRETRFQTVGDDWRIPPELTYIAGHAALIDDASGVQAQFQSPSLRILANLDVEPVILAAVFGPPDEVTLFKANPIQLQADENLNLQMNSNPAAVEVHYGLFWLSDGPIAPAQGNSFTVRCTAAITQTETTWVNGNLTFGQDLPAGSYAVVGMRARAATGVAARLVFQGQNACPGVPIVNAIGDADFDEFRHGRFGVFGTFPHTNPPTLDVLGGGAVAQVILLDLIKVG